MARFTESIEIFSERRKLIGHLMVEKIKNFLTYDADRDFYAKVFPGSVDEESLMRIRKMETTDLAEVLALEQKMYQYPWTQGIFDDCMVVGYYCWICEDKDKVFGYCILSVAVDEAHIMNLCVDPEFQGQGWGNKMLELMIETARAKDVDTLLLEVRPSNKAALALYSKHGFNEFGVRKGYYPTETGREDAVMLGLAL
jgi:ribosomal-protein-alanine N-acetyltransferase